MPCRTDYMEANAVEVELSRVLCLLGELRGEPFTREWWNGYHPQAYGNGRQRRVDMFAAQLCRKLQYMPASAITAQSLELQLWWRDHQAADMRHVAEDLAKARDAKNRRAALAKLTPYERQLLKLKDEPT